MLQTLIIDENNEHSRSLETKLKKYCPYLHLNGIFDKKEDYACLLKNAKIQLLFINPVIATPCIFDEIDLSGPDKALICVSGSADFIAKASYWNAVAYLLNPVQEEGLIQAVEAARKKVQKYQNEALREAIIQRSMEMETNEKDKLIGIPTIEGFEIISIDSIIRCEGLQKCTRIITSDVSDIVSSYNIGMYKKLLACSSHFFSAHRSHLVNMHYVSKFRKAGEIIMKDRSVVPISKNKREEFLSLITRI